MVSRGEFAAQHGWGDAQWAALAGDASTRRYDRLTGRRGSALLMQAPTDGQTPTVTADFVTVDEMLLNLGLSAPRILAAAPEQGLVLLEDFGDDTYTALLDGGAGAAPLYLLAVDTLIHLHRNFDAATAFPRLPEFDGDRFLDQAMLFCETCLPEGGEGDVAAGFRQAWARPLEQATAVPRSLLLRDFHAGNLFHLPERTGVRACGLIDFQDAGIGPVTYDLISLLQDARRAVAAPITEACLRAYGDAFPELDKLAFERSCAIMAAQRHVRVIAIFTRLAEKGKPGYLRHLPRLWQLLAVALAHPALVDVAAWFEAHTAMGR